MRCSDSFLTLLISIDVPFTTCQQKVQYVTVTISGTAFDETIAPLFVCIIVNYSRSSYENVPEFIDKKELVD
jgi:hypothetical protein